MPEEKNSSPETTQHSNEARPDMEASTEEKLPAEKKKGEKRIITMRPDKLERLAEFESFLLLRGKMPETSDFFKSFVTQAKSPTDTGNMFDTWMKYARALLVEMAKWERDNHDVDVMDVFEALRDPQHLMFGEEVPVDKRTDITLLLADSGILKLARMEFEKGSLIARLCHHFQNEVDDPDDCGIHTAMPEDDLAKINEYSEYFVRDMFHVFDGHRKYPPRGGVEEFYIEQMTYWARDSMDKTCSFVPENLSPLGCKVQKLCLGWEKRDWERSKSFVGARGFFLIDAPQKEVLKCFSREQQEKISTWSLSVPTVFLYSEYHEKDVIDQPWFIELAPESKHKDMQQTHPATTSAGVQAQHCARLKKWEYAPPKNPTRRGWMEMRVNIINDYSQESLCLWPTGWVDPLH